MLPGRATRERRINNLCKYGSIIKITRFIYSNIWTLITLVALLPIYLLIAWLYTAYIMPGVAYLFQHNMGDISTLPATSQTALLIGYSGFVLATVSFVLTTFGLSFKAIGDLFKGWNDAEVAYKKQLMKYIAMTNTCVIFPKQITNDKKFSSDRVIITAIISIVILTAILFVVIMQLI